MQIISGYLSAYEAKNNRCLFSETIYDVITFLICIIQKRKYL